MRDKVTPDRVTQLSMCEIFVFGSNLQGRHRGGAARFAHENFGAKWGVGVGRTGKCYAIPVILGSIDEIRPYVDDFVEYVRNHPNNRFLITRLGCGIAGFTDEEMAPLFSEIVYAPNVCLPFDWLYIMVNELNIPNPPQVATPKVITETNLKRLCEDYKYLIGTGISNYPHPKITVRYVIDQGRFGYARFGNFFFTEDGQMYVWTRDKEFADVHDQGVVEAYFGDECVDRGYCFRVIFAGVMTGYRDSNNEPIFTGDVIDMHGEFADRPFALSSFGDKRYAFMLDNHCIFPEECKKMTRVGTVFFMLDRDKAPTSIYSYCYSFQSSFPNRIKDEDLIMMSKFTPNFDQEIWKYKACEEFGIEFNWRK